MTTLPETISAAVRARGFALQTEVREAARLAEETNSPLAHAMVGDLIQLLEDTSEYKRHRRRSSLHARHHGRPTYAEGYTALGFFYDAVLDEPERAKPVFEKAVALGDTEAIEGLRSVVEQLGG